MIKYEQCVHFRSFAESTLQAAFSPLFTDRYSPKFTRMCIHMYRRWCEFFVKIHEKLKELRMPKRSPI